MQMAINSLGLTCKLLREITVNFDFLLEVNGDFPKLGNTAAKLKHKHILGELSNAFDTVHLAK